MTGKPEINFLSAPLFIGAAQPDIFDCGNRVQLRQSIGDKDASPSSHVTNNPHPPYLEALTASLNVLALLTPPLPPSVYRTRTESLEMTRSWRWQRLGQVEQSD